MVKARKRPERSALHVGVANDIHVPYHDAFAVAAFLKRVDDVRFDVLVLNGDIADFASVSLHDDGSAKPEFRHECEQVADFLADLRRRLPSSTIHYCEGNR